MNSFLLRHALSVIGMLSGFDRVRLRGTARMIANADGLRALLSHVGVLLKDFKAFALNVSDQIRASSRLAAETAGTREFKVYEPPRARSRSPAPPNRPNRSGGPCARASATFIAAPRSVRRPMNGTSTRWRASSIRRRSRRSASRCVSGPNSMAAKSAASIRFPGRMPSCWNMSAAASSSSTDSAPVAVKRIIAECERAGTPDSAAIIATHFPLSDREPANRGGHA